NRLSITTHADQLGATTMNYAHKRGWWKEGTPFDFQKSYSDWLYTTLGRASQRQACTTELSLKRKGMLDVNDCFNILKTHNLPEDKFKPSKANTGSVCMHATGLLNPSSTTGSMVAKIRKGAPHTVWLTGTPHPCLSIYIPFFFGTSVLEQLVTPDAQPDSSLWWRAERLHRWISKDYQKRKALIETKRQDLQCHFIEKEAALIRNNNSKPELEQFSKACLQEILHTYSDWMKLIN